MAHPDYDAFWQRQAMEPYLTRVTVPTLVVAGWWDQEDLYGPLHIYRTLEKKDTGSKNFLVAGPWNHGGWRREGRALGKIDFGAPTGETFRATFEAPFFATFLKGKGDHRPIEPTYHPKGSGWLSLLTEDQRFVHNRPDVLCWVTEPLEQDLVLAGEVKAKLFVSTTGQDADWIVKLIDVYPEHHAPDPKLGGYQLMVSNEVFRSRYRDSFEKPRPMAPNRITPITVGFHSQSYRFQKGHRVMVQVQSTWFPLIDRNPQTWVPNIFEAKASDFRAQTHRVWRGPAQASRVELQVVSDQ